MTTPSRTLLSDVAFRVRPIISSLAPTSGPVGTVVVITGDSLTGATSVVFGSAKATSFTVDSDSQITVPVPAGATTDRVFVYTPGGAAGAGTFTVN